MKLSTWAKKNGISYQTAWKWFKKGNLPVKAIQLPSGTILVEDDMVVKNFCLYCGKNIDNE